MDLFTQVLSNTYPDNGSTDAADIGNSKLGSGGLCLWFSGLPDDAPLCPPLGHRTDRSRGLCRFYQDPGDPVKRYADKQTDTQTRQKFLNETEPMCIEKKICVSFCHKHASLLTSIAQKDILSEKLRHDF